MINLSKIILPAALAFVAFVLTASAASAAVACNADNDCWHSREVYTYPAEGHVVPRPDDWMFSAGEPFRWHEHEGRGYWAGAQWREF